MGGTGTGRGEVRENKNILKFLNTPYGGSFTSPIEVSSDTADKKKIKIFLTTNIFLNIFLHN